MIVIAGCCLLVLLVVGLAIHLTTLDGIGGVLSSMVWEDSTQYAPGYTPAAFRCVRVGMKEEQVYALLGTPLDRHLCDGTVYLWYSKPQKAHFRDRRVMLRSRRVIGTNAEFYVD